ncbi:MAG: coniferyl-aldehyde dehydrogenase [Waddliaceae bacterium]|nr:coniferyl-aldehyde dehydrogenase [Waddliaceae bacterium]
MTYTLEKSSVLEALFVQQKLAAQKSPYPSYEQRIEALKKVQKLVVDNETLLTQALSEDFSYRSPHETRLLELISIVENCKYTCKRLAKWMKAEKRSVSLLFKPGKARVHYQPLGVIGNVVPWNYPIHLALGPLIGALAAGNRMLIKMSELTPKTGEVLQNLIEEYFSPDEVAVINGGTSVAQEFCSLPFDHLLFTGSSAVGKLVMQEASKNLTPVTLELGGKSPVIVDEDADLKHAAERVIIGKLLNAGQTCVAPDYVLIHEKCTEQFIHLCKEVANSRYPNLMNNPDYSAIINDHHVERLQKLLKEAEEQGAHLSKLQEGANKASSKARLFEPIIMTNVKPSMRIMQEEIFGPILPILSYRSIDEAIDYIAQRPHPLALYYFGKDRKIQEKVIKNTQCGGMTINGTMTHVAQEDLPFGGVGTSGMGQYHGKETFKTFSHAKSIYQESSWSQGKILYPPYGRIVNYLINKLLIKN